VCYYQLVPLHPSTFVHFKPISNDDPKF